MLLGSFETAGAHSDNHEVSFPMDLKAPQTVSTTLSRTGTPVFSSTTRAMPAPAKLVHKITTASAPSFITSSAAREILISETSPKLKLSVKAKCRSETHSNPSNLKFAIIFFCIGVIYGVTNPILVTLRSLSASIIDKEAVTTWHPVLL
mgnify:CR=1 FL=1